jgi:hypothetical protein
VVTVKEEQLVACEVVEIAAYDPANERMGKFVRVQFPGEDGTRRYTISKELNGDTPKPGAKVRLVLESFMKAQGARDGSGRVFYNEKRRVIGAIAA